MIEKWNLIKSDTFFSQIFFIVLNKYNNVK